MSQGPVITEDDIEAIPTMRTVVDRAETAAEWLQVLARAFGSQGAKEVDDNLAQVALHATLRLGSRLIEYARELQRLHHRRIGGYAIGYRDHDGRLMLVHHAWSWGNLMRTPHVESAALFATIEDVEAWRTSVMRSHGEDAKHKPWPPPGDQLVRRDGTAIVLRPYPVRVEIGEPGPQFTTTGEVR